MEAAILGIVVVMTLLVLGVPIGFAMGGVAIVGMTILIGWNPALSLVGTTLVTTAQSYELSVIPLFILMGNFVVGAGLSRELYRMSNAFLGHFRGGLALSTILASAGFSSVSGSSLGTVATMSKVAMEPMRNYGYASSLAAGSVASGATLGILIPPSVPLILYGLMTGTDIGRLFLAGILPGLFGVAMYMATVVVVTARNPALGPPSERASWSERWQSLRGVWGIVVLFLIVIGGIYLGVFTATEAAGVGAFGAFVFALLRGQLTPRKLLAVFVDCLQITTALFTVLFGALMFSSFMNLARLPEVLATTILGSGLSPLLVVLVICIIYIILGCMLESISMMLLTVPIFFPIIIGLGFDPVWFGIIVVVVIEISLITPPVGMNVFVLRSMQPDIPLVTIFRGVMPFIVADFFRLAILVLIPAWSLFLPNLMR